MWWKRLYPLKSANQVCVSVWHLLKKYINLTQLAEKFWCFYIWWKENKLQTDSVLKKVETLLQAWSGCEYWAIVFLPAFVQLSVKTEWGWWSAH